MLLECLALLHDIQVFLQQGWEQTKHALRDWLGPGPRKWYLTSDFQITHLAIPDSLVFCPISNRICKMDQVDAELRTKRLPWLAVCVKNRDSEWDFSEWLSDVRIATDCPIPPLLQIVRLASHVNHMHVFETNETTVRITNRNGEEEVYEYRGSIELVQQE
jgi:hypothetical protein